MMSMIVTVVMAMIMIVMVLSLLTWLKNAVNRITEFLDGSLEDSFICLCCIILESHSHISN